MSISRLVFSNQSFPLLYLFSRAWYFARDARRQMVAYVIMSIGSICILALEPIFIGKFISALQDSAALARNPLYPLRFLFIYGTLDFFSWVLHGPARVIERQVSLKVKTSCKLELFSAATSFPMSWHVDHHSGEIVDRVSRSANALGDFVDRSFETIQILTRYCAAIIGLGFFMPQASLIVASASVVIFLTTTLFDRELVALERALNRLHERVSGAIHDYLSNITTVITLRLEQRAANEVLRRLKELMPGFSRRALINELKWFLNSMLIRITIVSVVAWFYMKSVPSGNALNIGAIVSLFEYLRIVGDSFFGMSWKLAELVTAAESIRVGDRLLSESQSVGIRHSNFTLPRDWRRIEVRNVLFSHPSMSKPTLNGVSVELARGAAIAVLGESGSGKSTLLGILRLLHRPAEAKVFIDGELSESGLERVAGSSTLVPQEPEVFAESVRYNITMGIAATDEEVLAAIQMARFSSVLKRLPNGLDTSVAEKGISLSGGEKQRLALARAIFFSRDSQILLLDESTSSVDSVNESAIYSKLLAEFSDRVVVATIHKLNLLPFFSYIYLLENGKVVEEGAYRELLVRHGKVAELIKAYNQTTHTDVG